MIENPGTCFLQYPKVPITCYNSFFDWGICICSTSFQVSGGTVPKNSVKIKKTP